MKTKSPRTFDLSRLTAGVLMAAILGTTSAAVLQAQDATSPAPEAAPAAASTEAQANEPERLQASIREVRGIVQYRLTEEDAWQRVEVGQSLDVGVEFRTGPRSAVTFHLPPDQLVTLDRLGTLKLLDAINNEDKTVATTELGMRYGRTRYQVEGAQGVEHQATIRAPSATLAIRGTQDVTLTDQRPGPASASSKSTRVYFRPTGSPKQVVFGSNENNTEQTVEEGDDSPGETTSRKRIVDSGPANARSTSEFQILNDFELYNGPQLTNQGIRTINVPSGGATTQPSGGDCGGEGGGGGGLDEM